ncbi:MAG: hypothetical protein Q9159_002707 [Coniocarpon cinnabarinum]
MREQLLRQALESSKTTSKKQRTKQASLASSGLASRSSSKANSAANSRAGSTGTSRSGSRVGSRAGTDDEHDSLEGFDSDDTSDDFGNTLGAQLEEVDSWQTALATRIGNILNRGKRHADERPEDLRWYTGILQNHYATVEIQGQLPQLIRQLLRACTAEDEKEASLALKALSVTAVTDQSEDYFEECSGPLKSLIQDYGDEDVKADALRTLAMVAYISGSLSDLISVLTFLLEIIESDGHRILAEDSAVVVSAALNAFSICCTRVPNFDPEAEYLQDVDREFSQEAIESIAEQLESSAPSVQIAAAEVLALLFEKSYRKATLEDSANLQEDVHTGELPDVVQMYNPYRNTSQLLDQLQEVYKGSSKSTAKVHRRALNDTLRDVTQSIEHSGWGPGWRAGEGWKSKGRDNRNAAQKRHLGPSIKIKTDPNGGMFVVERWWQLIRVRDLRTVIGHGFMEHFAENPVVEESLFKEHDEGNDSDEDDEGENDEGSAVANGETNGHSVPDTAGPKSKTKSKQSKRGMDKWRR